jgi:hypothetical protein
VAYLLEYERKVGQVPAPRATSGRASNQ